MAKTLNDVYTAFLSKLSEDDWLGWDDEDILADWKTIYQSAVPNFKFPRVEIPNPDEVDVDEPTELTNLEVQIIATYMKCEWLDRNILDWENVKPMYDEKDYSPANYLSKLNALLDREEKKAAKLEAKYYRSIDGKPFSYSTKFMG
jgi:hypothetical protein